MLQPGNVFLPRDLSTHHVDGGRPVNLATANRRPQPSPQRRKIRTARSDECAVKENCSREILQPIRVRVKRHRRYRPTISPVAAKSPVLRSIGQGLNSEFELNGTRNLAATIGELIGRAIIDHNDFKVRIVDLLQVAEATLQAICGFRCMCTQSPRSAASSCLGEKGTSAKTWSHDV